MSLTDHVNDDTAMLHRAIADALGRDPAETEGITLEILDMLGGRTCYLASGSQAQKALAKEKARALLDQGLGPVDVQRRVAEDDDVGTLCTRTIEKIQE
jgi:Mor family transcriptional regulator